MVDFDHALVALVGDQDVAVRQIGILHRSVQLIEARAGDARPSILPDNVAVLLISMTGYRTTIGKSLASGGAPVPATKLSGPTR